MWSEKCNLLSAELTCGKTKMVLVLPITSFQNVNLTELQLNSPTCPISHNNTHLTASISLNGCGTETMVTIKYTLLMLFIFICGPTDILETFKNERPNTLIQDQIGTFQIQLKAVCLACLFVFQHTGSELVYVNTLQSVPSFSVVKKNPSLFLPLACRIPGVQAKGPSHRLNIPTEKEVFGPVAFSIKLYFPGEGPFGNFTRVPRLLDSRTRVRRDAEPPLESANNSFKAGSRIQMLYLTVMSNCSIGRAEMVVSNCIESETEDFAKYTTIITQGSVMVDCHFLDYYRDKTKIGSVH